MSRLVFVLIVGLVLAACDATQTPPTQPTPTPEPEPEPEPVIGYRTIRVDGVNLYGVQKERLSDGGFRYIIADELKGVFRFGVFADLTVVEECPVGVDVCRDRYEGEADRAVVTFDRPVQIDGETREPGTDVADHFDFFERDWLVGRLPEPTPLFHVGFDTTRVSIPGGDHHLTVRWVREAHEDLETTQRFEYDPLAED